jgi:hypothetical protein
MKISIASFLVSLAAISFSQEAGLCVAHPGMAVSVGAKEGRPTFVGTVEQSPECASLCHIVWRTISKCVTIDAPCQSWPWRTTPDSRIVIDPDGPGLYRALALRYCPAGTWTGTAKPDSGGTAISSGYMTLRVQP